MTQILNMQKYNAYKDSGVEWLGEIPKHWETIIVKRLGKTKAGGTPSTNILKYWDGEIPWLPSGKLQNCEIVSADKFITESGLKYSATKLIKPNTVLIALTGATCANIGYLKFEACANQSVIAIEENKGVDSKFLYYALINERLQILLSQTGGTSRYK
ncbi:MAG: restriction endonuclease subunit S [Sphingobacteriales bacterium]|nr:restriction endonuclease subunit S [Sphingobacteriales bacterium]